MSFSVLGDRPQSDRAAWRVIVVAALFFFYEFIQMTLFNAINPYLMTDFHTDAAGLSHLSSAYLWADTLFLIPAGLLLDRLSPRRLILVNMFLCILVTALFSVTDSFMVAWLCRLVAGVGNAFSFLACMHLASRWFDPSKLAFVSGVIITIGLSGGMMAQAPLTFLVSAYGWRVANLMNAGFGVILFFLMLMYVRDREGSFTPGASSEGLWPGLITSLKNPQNWYAGGYTSFLNIPLMVLGALWGGFYLERVYGVTSTQASYVISMIFLGTIVGSPVAGAVSDRWQSRRLPMLWGAVLSIFPLYLLFFVRPSGVWPLSLIMFALGFLTSAQVIGYPVVAESNDPKITSTAMGLASTFIMGGAALGQDVFGMLLQNFWDGTLEAGVPFYKPEHFQKAMWMLWICVGLSWLMAFLSRETFPKGGAKT